MSLHAAPGPTRPLRPLGQTRRPAVLDASQTALIPLRPLTISEVLDASFLVIRGNPGMMLGLPVAIAAAGVVCYMLVAGIWLIVGELSGQVAAAVLSGLTALAAGLALSMCVSWMTAVLSRLSLQTALGDGYAPTTKITWRQATSMFWPMAGLSLLQSVAANIVSTIASSLGYVALVPIMVTSVDGVSLVVGFVVYAVVTLAIFSAGYVYISLVVPAWAAESHSTPGWIGKPTKPTNIATAFVRSFQLVGLRNLVRGGLVIMAVATLASVIAMAVYGALALLILLYTDQVGIHLSAILVQHPGVVLAGYAAVFVVTISALVAFFAAVQTILYLDLRMRREGLDLALRFDLVNVPQPHRAPAPVYFVPPPGGDRHG